ncbi:PD-(D/E)XK nuclease family protein [Candidatus Woesearchaeota archaeon]|nr:PD-(D/E)XK nuclease family protein [Candidatus Woesearchaeota archaeon]
MKAISVSQLRKYEACPRQYEQHYILQKPEETSFHSVFGTLVHAALEAYHAHPERHLLDCYREEFKKPEYRVLDAGLYEKGQVMLQEYLLDTQGVTPPNILNLEERVELTLPNGVPVIGVIDRIDKIDDETIAVVDYKTGASSFPTSYELETDEQLSMYDVMARQLHPWAKTVLLRLHYFQGPKLTTQRKPHQREAFLDYVATLYQEMITSTIFPPRLNSYCGYCTYRKDCPAYQLTLQESVSESVQGLATVEEKIVRPLAFQLPDDLPKLAGLLEQVQYKRKILERVEKDCKAVMKDYMENTQQQAVETEDRVITLSQREYTYLNPHVAHDVLGASVFFGLATVPKEKVEEYLQEVRLAGRAEEAARMELALQQSTTSSFTQASLKVSKIKRVAKITKAKGKKALDTGEKV